jgi:Mlc titration factor MtfA (ptsG expression regulator)
VQAWPRRIIRLHAAGAFALAGVIALALLVMAPPLAALAGPLVGVVYFALATRRFRRRRALLASPFPESWRALLERRVPFYRRLSGDGRARFEDDVRIFLAEQRIYGVHGAAVDDEVRLLIAASAAMLGHGLPEWEWTNLRDVVVYPKAFDDDYNPHAGGGIAGMVHAQGPILLSRSDLSHGFSRPKDGHNVALHELAHVMDFADGRADGVPADVDWVASAPWIETIADRLRQMRRKRGDKPLRAYAGQNEAELFAVAVEAFFEQPERLSEKDPELYALLAEYLNQDPRLVR